MHHVPCRVVITTPGGSSVLDVTLPVEVPEPVQAVDVSKVSDDALMAELQRRWAGLRSQLYDLADDRL